jgi:nitrous oxidase accessory protein NosD
MRLGLSLLCGLVAAVALVPAARADTIRVSPGESVQAAIDAAGPDDVIELAEGEYAGDVDFGGKRVTVRGAGPATVLRGTGQGPVVRFENAEGAGSVLDSVTVRGGVADRGGGISIRGASPVVVRCVVTRNRARSQGSGIFVTAGSAALIFNNLLTYNRREGPGDPHVIEVVDAAPAIVNNTVARGDSNGLILRGNSAANVVNNVFAYNGSRVGGQVRGRGICDFSGGRARILSNLFHRNRVAALLRGGRDWRKARNLERTAPDPLVSGNVDGGPGFRRGPARRAARSRARHFELRRRGRARDRGLDDAGCSDLDGTRNDVGHTGGPFAAGSSAVPGTASCGASLP